jgi:hypothetical protein
MAWDKSPEGVALRLDAVKELQSTTSKLLKAGGWTLKRPWKLTTRGISHDTEATYSKDFGPDTVELVAWIESTGKARKRSAAVRGITRLPHVGGLRTPGINMGVLIPDGMSKAPSRIARAINKLNKTLPIYILDILQEQAAKEQAAQEKAEAEARKKRLQAERQQFDDLFYVINSWWNQQYARYDRATSKWESPTQMEFRARPFPRFDHGGGEYGDDWMEDHYVDEIVDPEYRKVETFIKDLKGRYPGLIKDHYIDHGEKGHFHLGVTLSKPRPKKQASVAFKIRSAPHA